MRLPCDQTRNHSRMDFAGFSEGKASCYYTYLKTKPVQAIFFPSNVIKSMVSAAWHPRVVV